MGNSILNQLILVMMMLKYQVLWDSYTKPANLDEGDIIIPGVVGQLHQTS